MNLKMTYSITPSHLLQYLFCPRFIYFENVLHIPQYQDRHYKVQKGRAVHDVKSDQNSEYLRRRIGVTKKQTDVYLTNDLLRGAVDEVLWLEDGTMAPLDYKFAKWNDKIYDTSKTQLYCYAWLIQDNFGLPVTRGYLVYTRSRHKLVEVAIDEKAVGKVRRDAAAIMDIIQKNKYPKATRYKKKCVSCTYRNICTK